MQLHHFSFSNRKKGRRIGRGGKRGTTSGRGQKGQRSRSGHRIRPAERDLILRIPKRRGFANKPKSEKAAVFNLAELVRKLKVRAGKEPLVLNKELLKRFGILSMRYGGKVKILGGGEISVPLRVEGIPVSESARKKIEKAGGKIT